jgi:hypothetical protein
MRIIYEPAECHPYCYDNMCPYLHCEAWTIMNDLGQFVKTFSTEKEAKEYVENHGSDEEHTDGNCNHTKLSLTKRTIHHETSSDEQISTN